MVLQKKAVRAICSLPYNHHTSSFFKSSTILKLQDHFHLKSSLILFKCIKLGTFEFLRQYISRNSSVHMHSTRNRNSLRLPRYKYSRTQKSFIYTSLKVWNDYIPSINPQSLNSLKEAFCNICFSNY